MYGHKICKEIKKIWVIVGLLFLSCENSDPFTLLDNTLTSESDSNKQLPGIKRFGGNNILPSLPTIAPDIPIPHTGRWTAPDGTSYIIIAADADFEKINENPSDNYILWNDIDFSDSFTPLSSDRVFSGVLEGNGKKIAGLSILLDNNDDVGLFKKIGDGGIVRNLIFEYTDVQGKNYVGILAGRNEGIIHHIILQDSNNVTGISFVGGLVGYNNGFLEKSFSNSSVNGSGNTIGGVAGWNRPSSSIDQCYYSGTVQGSDDVGGLVGWNEGRIQNCYSLGNTIGHNNTGGLIGWNAGFVTNSFALGDVKGYKGKTGVVVGFTTSSLQGAYFTTSNTASLPGVGRTEVDPRTVISVTSYNKNDLSRSDKLFGWDFTSIWYWRGAGLWPNLQWQHK